MGAIQSDSACVILVSFEGPDRYSQAGGLGVRVTGLARTLASLNFETHLFFIGDPALPGEERIDDRLTLHRWGQWISAMSPHGVYDDEHGKANDLASSLPSYVVDRIALPAVAAGKTPIFLLEEWQTSETACRIADALTTRGLRDRAIVAWNANNPYGFERIDWQRLAASSTITTISRYMRGIIRACGADARIVPNGLPDDAFAPVAPASLSRIRDALGERRAAGMLFKMARWEREKGWIQALDAMACFRADPAWRDRSPVLVARSGGPTSGGGRLIEEAEARGLVVHSIDDSQTFINELESAVVARVDVIALKFGVSPQLARTVFAAADGVLANSVSEPFGLVGLEAMAAGGIVFTGGTGEDYAVDRRNAIVLQTLDPLEIVAGWQELVNSQTLGSRFRRAARKTAREYEWRTVVGLLLDVVTGALDTRSRHRRTVAPRRLGVPEVGMAAAPSLSS
jgi:glycosyltransferase involved in cell wall biosynthesis